MWFDFILENSHFTASLLVALVFFAVFWLHLDAWLVRKELKESLKFVGFLLLSISFLAHATRIESALLSTSFGSEGLPALIDNFSRLGGYVLIIAGQIIDPLQEKPKTKGLSFSAFLPFKIASFTVVFFVLAISVGLLYLRRATTGLERHLKPVAISFFVLSASELISLASLFRDTNSVDFFNLVKPHGPAWIAEHILLVVATVFLGKWVFSYLLKRLQTQLFMIFNMVILAVFLLTTVSFTFLLIRNLQNESLKQLETNARALNLSIEGRKEEALSDAQVVAQNSQVTRAVKEKDLSFLANFSESFLLTKKQSFLMVVDSAGVVLARGEDKERVGDSLSDDTLVKRALLGVAASSIVSRDSVLAPQIFVRASTPVKEGDSIVGAVVTGTILDNAFMDGLKQATGLEASLFSGKELSATTLVSGVDKVRPLGIKEENKSVVQTVLGKGAPYKGALSVLNVPYFVGYLPLKDVDNSVVGMVFVGREQSAVLKTAGRSIELTFLVTAGLLVASVVPAFLVSRRLASQLS
ncbi:MAG TPA: cache domain-containing protein [Candidatus Nanoarchaeia archaeon]